MLTRISKGDWEGFFAGFVNNLIQLLILTPLCLGVLGFSAELVIGRILPGIAISFLVGNLYYAYLARKIARQTGNANVTALPYGISTPAVFANIFLVMLPAKIMAEAQGHPQPEELAWQAGLLACMLGGLIEIAGAFCASQLRRWVPRAALLSSLGGVGMGFLGLAFLFQLLHTPTAGIPILFLSLLLLLKPFALPTWLPATGILLVVGSLLGWFTGLAPVNNLGLDPASTIHLHLPLPQWTALSQSLSNAHIASLLSIVLPISFLSVIASLQNIESAAAAGDHFPEKPCLLVNGLGTLAAACFGSAFPTSIYIGHPAWKQMGARHAYSVLNGIAISLLCLTGTLGLVVWLIPVEAGISIIFWIGLIITIQCFDSSPKHHYPAVIVGLMPGITAWIVVVLNTVISSASQSSSGQFLFNSDFLKSQANYGNFLGGGISLQQGFLLTAMIWSSLTVFMIERQFLAATLTSLIAAALAAIGLTHAYQITEGALLIRIPLLEAFSQSPTQWIAAPAETTGYLITAALFALIHQLSKGKACDDNTNP